MGRCAGAGRWLYRVLTGSIVTDAAGAVFTPMADQPGGTPHLPLPGGRPEAVGAA
jgi:hypothetical protein